MTKMVIPGRLCWHVPGSVVLSSVLWLAGCRPAAPSSAPADLGEGAAAEHRDASDASPRRPSHKDASSGGAVAPRSDPLVTDDGSPIAVNVRCKDGATCQFRGQDLGIEIVITNKHSGNLGFPLAYVKKAGPVIRLIDSRTGADTHLRRNLADPALKTQLTAIAPGASVSYDWIVFAAEASQFGEPVDVTVEVTVMAPVAMDGRTVEVRGTGSLHVRGKSSP